MLIKFGMAKLAIEGPQNFSENSESIPSYFSSYFLPAQRPRVLIHSNNFGKKQYGSWKQVGTNEKYFIQDYDNKLTVLRTQKINSFIDGLAGNYIVDNPEKLKFFLASNYRICVMLEKLLAIVSSGNYGVKETTINLVSNVEDIQSFVSIEFFIGSDEIDSLAVDDSFKSSNLVFRSIAGLEFYFL